MPRDPRRDALHSVQSINPAGGLCGLVHIDHAAIAKPVRRAVWLLECACLSAPTNAPTL